MQAHLLEQLIGMQNAIESMESPMEQNEETMSVFMNMLEADAGLGGDFAELTFKSSPWPLEVPPKCDQKQTSPLSYCGDRSVYGEFGSWSFIGSKENFDLSMENLAADLLQVYAIGLRYG